MQYTGDIVKNVEKDAKVLLVGVNGTAHTNVRIKVDITGPATPKILATDSNGTQHDIAQLGYWGPDAGFPVQGDFTNTTPIKATFTQEGTYTIKLSLIDVANANAVITSKTFTIAVANDQAPVNNTTTPPATNNTLTNNTIEELPQTGTSVGEYIIYILGFGIVLIGLAAYFNRKNRNN